MWSRLGTVSLALLLVVVTVRSESEPNGYAPELLMNNTDGRTVQSYEGYVVSDEFTVALDPELKATDKDEIGGARFICGYSIYKDEGRDYEIPFEVEVINHFDGKARLRVKEGAKLDANQRKKYKFQIAAFDCGNPTLHSEKAHVVVRVMNSFATTKKPEIEIVTEKLESPPIPELFDTTVLPLQESTAGHRSPPIPDIGPPSPPTRTNFDQIDFFERSSYIIAIREGTLYDSILHLKPADVHSKENVCGYEIVTTDVPFSVDVQGNIKNTRVLDFKHQTSYILSVVAKHCDGTLSKPVMINVQVSEMCLNGWKDLPQTQAYAAGTKAIYPFAKTFFDTCSDTCDREENLEVTITLDSKGEINTCQHDTYSIESQRKSCGASEQTVDLLPKGQVWTESLAKLESGDSAYKFDGKTAVSVPSEHSNHTLENLFTLGMWMRHGQEKKDGHKEHVLCNSDGDQMNRHHYALFVHNCRLVFLLRKEADQVDDMNKFMPAEWRWNVPHVCDDQWHHYAISVDYPKVNLHIDGQMIQTDKETVEIVDDWALHPTKKVHFDQLTVGACWQGATSDYGQYFDGYLAGVTMLRGSTETDRVIKCMNNCGEKLQFHAMALLQDGMSVTFNTELTEFTVKGSDPEEVKMLLQKVGYSNTNGEAKPEMRRLHIRTNATCNGKSLTVVDQVIPVYVTAVQDPKIHIEGVTNKMRRVEEFNSGVDLFTELMIVSDPDQHLGDQSNRINKLTVEDLSSMQKELKTKLLLDRCEVRVEPAMKSGSESLRLPSELLITYLLDSTEFDEGFDLMGSETFTHYENVLKEVFYHNSAIDDSFQTKKFSVKCFNMNGKFESNLFSLQVGLIKSAPHAFKLYSDPSYAHAQEAAAPSLEEGKAVFEDVNSASSSAASPAMIAVVVVCVLFLVAVICVAIVRIRTVHKRRGGGAINLQVEDGPTLEWDDTTLNITVNPLESDTLMHPVRDEEDDLDSSSDEEDGGDNYKERDLEWDNSTLSY